MDRSRFLGKSISRLQVKWKRSSRLQKIASATVVASMLLAQAASVTLPVVEAQVPPHIHAAHSPRGYFDGVTANCEYLTGWVCDASDYSSPVDVHIYQNAPYGQAGSKFLVKDWAKEPAPQDSEMTTICGGYNMHRFRIPVPNSVKDGQRHALYAYGINIGIGSNTRLSNGLQYVKCDGNGGGGNNGGGGGGGNVNLDIQSSGPAEVKQGGEVVYHIKVTNNGSKKTDTARVLNYFLRDGQRVLRPLTFLPNQTKGGANCNYSATDPDRAIECDVQPMDPGQTKNIELHFRVENGANCGALITNHSAVKNGRGDEFPVHDFENVKTTVKCDQGGNNGGGGGGNVNLDIQASGPATVGKGDEIVYRLQVTNKGSKRTETARVLNYYLRDGQRVIRPVTFLENKTEGGASCNFSQTEPDRAVECDVQPLDPGQTRNIVLHFRVDSDANCGALLTNHSAVKNGRGADEPVHDFENVKTDVKCGGGGNNGGGGGGNVNLDIQATGPATVGRGGEIVYRLQVTNKGSKRTETARVLNYYLRDGQRVIRPVTFLENKTEGGASCNFSQTEPDRAVECDLLPLDPGQTRNIVLHFRVDSDANCGALLTNHSAVKNGRGADEPVHDFENVKTDVKCGGGGSSSSSDGNGHDPIGHFGGSNAQGIKLYGWTCDPDDFSRAIDVHIYRNAPFGSAGSQFLVAGTANFTGETAVADRCGGFNAHRFYIDAPQSIKDGNVHQLYAYGINIGPGKNVLLNGSPYQYRFTGGGSSSSSSSQGGNAVLTVDKSTNQSTVRHGEAIFYTITVRNVGNGTANNVQVYDIVPHGLNYQPNGSSNGCNLTTVNGVQQVRCQSFNLAPGAAQTFTLKFMVNHGQLACGQTIRNQADVEANNAALQWDDVFSTVICDGSSSSSSSSTSSSSSSSSTGVCHGSTDLIVQKTGQATVTQGGQIVYTITVTNVSNCDAHQVVVNDVIPGNTFFLTSSGASCTQNTANNVACTLGTIHAGQQRTFTVTFQTYNNVACNTTIYNTATVSTTTNESNTGNNQSQTVNTSVSCGGNSSSSSSYGFNDFYVDITDGESEVEQGDEVEYVLTVRNNQNQTVNNVTATVLLDSDVDYDSCSDNCSQNGRTITWNNLSFGPGQTRTFRVDAEVEDDADDELETTAYVGNFSDTDETDVEDDDVDSDDDDDNVRIELNIETSAGEVLPGGIIYYTVRVRNTGNVNIRDDINVTINLPSGVTVIDNGGASYFGNELRWIIDGLNEGDSWSKTFRVSVNSNQTPGTVLYTNVRAFGGGVDESRSVSVNVIGSLPQTGFMTGCASGQCLKLSSINGGAGTPSAPIAVMLSLMGMGAGAGIGLGRRFFFV